MAEQNRRHPRRRSKTEASVQIGSDGFHGTLMDTSAEGVFFRPNWGLVAGLFVAMDEPTVGPKVNEQVQLSISHRGQDTTSEAVVRWVGCSNEHWSHGFGLEFKGSPRPPLP